MANPILRSFRSLHMFSGRDSQGQFWPYAGVAILLILAFAFIAMPFAVHDIFADMERFATEHPEAATVQRSPTSYSMSIDGSQPDAPHMDLSNFFLVMRGIVLLAVVLLSAAVSRRLHDCNRPAWFGLAPAIFLVAGIVLMPRMMDDMMTSPEPNFGMLGLLFLNNILYLVTLAGLIVQCALKGTAGPNRYGPEPTPAI
ncbi:MAG: DUF805 domain-containing protein [Brevundimonas sp.]|uniref:DUF805 domain-containing protein n=1 Tax=Brevundimonas sp. TaxID=1871086 RepID=UPI0027363D77|nr:DUF805 domain-containing protein [Brevundimonas sp.]MDP3403389.1 DUF805 domain-containing protein [Brevundimonas sp.]